MTFLIANWRIVLLALLLAIIGVQTLRLDRCQTSFHDYKVSVEALGRAQQLENERIQKEREVAEKESTDAKNRAIADLSSRYASARRMLDNARRGGVPAPSEAPALATACKPSGSPDPRLGELEAALLDALERADQELVKYRELWAWTQKAR